MTKKNRAIIQREYRDSDGYWIELTPGWQNGADPGCHGIVEDTKRQAYSTLTMAKPCSCGECQRLQQEQQEKERAEAGSRRNSIARLYRHEGRA